MSRLFVLTSLAIFRILEFYLRSAESLRPSITLRHEASSRGNPFIVTGGSSESDRR